MGPRDRDGNETMTDHLGYVASTDRALTVRTNHRPTTGRRHDSARRPPPRPRPANPAGVPFTVKVSRRWHQARAAVMRCAGRYAWGSAAPLGLFIDYYA